MTPKRVLAIKLREMGDTLIMTAPLTALKKRLPDVEIHAVVKAAWAPLLERNPAITRVWPVELSESLLDRVSSMARLSLKLRHLGFDWAVNFHASPSSALLARMSGAHQRSIHFHGHRDPNRFSTVEIPGKGQVRPAIERDMDAVRALGLSIPPNHGLLPRIFLEDHELRDGLTELRKRFESRPVLAIGPGASRPTKIWPIERFAGVARRWCEEHDGGVAVVTGPGEEQLTQDFFRALPVMAKDRCRRLHALPLRELASILHHCSGYLGNDSGPKHLAVSVGQKTITLFGPEDPFEWHPYPRDLHPLLFMEDLTCRRDAQPGMPPWCGLHTCDTEKHRCMRSIGEEEVWEKVKATFFKGGAS